MKMRARPKRQIFSNGTLEPEWRSTISIVLRVEPPGVLKTVAPILEYCQSISQLSVGMARDRKHHSEHNLVSLITYSTRRTSPFSVLTLNLLTFVWRAFADERRATVFSSHASSAPATCDSAPSLGMSREARPRLAAVDASPQLVSGRQRPRPRRETAGDDVVTHLGAHPRPTLTHIPPHPALPGVTAASTCM